MFFYLWYECKLNQFFYQFYNFFYNNIPQDSFKHKHIELVDIDHSMYQHDDNDDDWDKV